LTIRYPGLCLYVSLISISCFLTALLGCGGGSDAVESPHATAPVVTGISPTTVPVGWSDFTLTVAGSGFVSESIVRENGAPLPTTFVSVGLLTAKVTASLAATGGNLAISVLNPDGQSSTGGPGGSGDIALGVTVGTPTITSLAPDTVTAGSAATDVVVTGTNFVPASTASFGGSPRPAQVRSATLLAVSLSAADLASPATTAITVTNPPPGGGTSAPASFRTVSSNVPILTGSSPAAVTFGNPQVTLTLSGANFVPLSRVMVNNVFEPTQYLSPSTLIIGVSTQYFYSKQWQVMVANPGGGFSNQLLIPVVNPVPALTSISPAKVTAGAPDFLLQVSGDGFLEGSQILVNGSPREALDVSPPSSLRVPIAAKDVATAGSLEISVLNPAPGGGTSSSTKLQIMPALNRLRAVNVQANDLAWDPKRDRIYAAVGAGSTSYANSIVAIDPESGTIVASQTLGSEPALLSLTSDQQYLYVSLPGEGSVARLILPGLTPDIQWALGADSSGRAYHAVDLQAAPGQAHTIAVTRTVYTSGGTGGIVIYDDGQARPNIALDIKDFGAMYQYIQWGADATILYASVGTITGAHEHTFAVTSTGLALAKDAADVFVSLDRFFFDPATARFYEGMGSEIDAATGKLLGMLSTPHMRRDSPGPFAVDSKNHRIYIVGFNNAGLSNEAGAEIQVFDQDHFSYINSLFVTSNNAYPASLIRWGSAGLALAGDQVYLLDGPFVTPGAVASSDTGGYASPAPTLLSITPEVVAGGSGTTVVIATGTDFTETSTVTWNGNQVSTVFVSPTELQLTLPAGSLTKPVSGPITASNGPGSGLSNSLAFTVLPDLGPDLQLSAINLPGFDLAWNAAQNILYVAVPDADRVNGNSIASVDPTTSTLKSATFAGSQPSVLAISDNDQYLYAGFAHNAVVQRYALPSMSADITVPLGVGHDGSQGPPGASDNCDFAISLGVAPGAPRTIAVSQGNSLVDFPACGQLAVFDDAVPRINTAPDHPDTTYHDYESIAWANGGDSIYAQSSASSQDLFALSVSSSGVTFDKFYFSVGGLGYQLHYDAGTGYLYSDGGRATNPADGSAIGDFKASGLVAPDSKLGRAFFLGQTSDQGYGTYTLQVFDIRNFELIKSIVIPDVIGLPARLVRWGDSGLAFVTCCGSVSGNNAPGLVYVLSGPAISGPASTTTTPAATEHVHLRWKPRQSSTPKSNDVITGR
jgi:hypothetical protein